jgi:hypothetical protein
MYTFCTYFAYSGPHFDHLRPPSGGYLEQVVEVLVVCMGMGIYPHTPIYRVYPVYIPPTYLPPSGYIPGPQDHPDVVSDGVRSANCIIAFYAIIAILAHPEVPHLRGSGPLSGGHPVDHPQEGCIPV